MIKPLIQKILVAINGSQQSVQAAMYAIMMAKQLKCELEAVYVVDTATLKQLTMSKFFVAEESERYEQSLIEDGERYLKYVESIAKPKGVKITAKLVKGIVWAELVKEAEAFEADVILLGGKNQVTSVIGDKQDAISATNADIIANARCNVLVVRKKDVEKLFKIA